MKTILSYPLSILYYLCFGILLFSFQIIQWFCLNMFGYYAHKKSVDILNYLILLSLSIIKTRIFFEAESNLPPPGKNVIFIANHQSTYDIPPLIWKLRNYHMKFVSKKELGRGIPSISYNLRNGGSILIDREKPKEAIISIKNFTYGKFFFHLGPDKDKTIYKGLENYKSELKNCDYILCTGLYDHSIRNLEYYNL